MEYQIGVENVTDRLLYRVGEAAEAIGVSRAQCYALIAQGKIPAVRLGASLRVPVDRLRQLVDQKLAESSAA